MRQLPKKLSIFSRGEFLLLPGFTLFKQLFQPVPKADFRDCPQELSVRVERMEPELRPAVFLPFLEAVIEYHDSRRIRYYLQNMLHCREPILSDIFNRSTLLQKAELLSTYAINCQIDPFELYASCITEVDIPAEQVSIFRDLLQYVGTDERGMRSKKLSEIFKAVAQKVETSLHVFLLWLAIAAMPLHSKRFVKCIVGMSEASMSRRVGAQKALLEAIVNFLHERWIDDSNDGRRKFAKGICPYFAPLALACCYFDLKDVREVVGRYSSQFASWWQAQDKLPESKCLFQDAWSSDRLAKLTKQAERREKAEAAEEAAAKKDRLKREQRVRRQLMEEAR
jgi:hypothetical protein